MVEESVAHEPSLYRSDIKRNSLDESNLDICYSDNIAHMITIECKDIMDLMVELAAYISENVAVVSAVKTKDIVLDPLAENVDPNHVVVLVKTFLARKSLSKDFLVKSSGEKITVVALVERKVRVEHTDSGLFVCPHCGKVTPYEEEMNVHVRAHYII